MPDECCIVDLVQVRPSQEMSCCTAATGGSDKNIYREAVQPERDRSRSPLFQVLFSLQNAPSSPLNLSNITATEIAMPMPTAKFDLSLHMWETADGLGGSFEYNTDLFDETTLTRMTTHLQKVLEEMVGWPGQALSAFSLVTASESELILKQWNATESEELPDISLHQLVEAQVERTPDATAISYDNHSLTYRELNARANQLAHHLQRLGVGPEVPVGICMKRSIEMIIGVLGILKSGGAYLPLDVSYPLERINFMLTDTKARLVITQREVKMHLADT